MTPAQVDLARQLVALPGWTDLDDEDGPRSGLRYVQHGREWLTDLTDPATGGILLEILGAAVSGDVEIRSGLVAGSRRYWLSGPGLVCRGSTLAEACARALVTLGRCQ